MTKPTDKWPDITKVVMRFSLIFALFLYTPFLAAQEVSGKIYLNTSVGSGVKVENITRDYSSYSTKTGEFHIAAQLQDTLIFGGNLLQVKQLIVDSMALQHPAEIQLTVEQFSLEEVVLTTTQKDRLNVKKYNASFRQKLKKDLQKNPYLYNPSHGNIGDLGLFVIRKIKKLVQGKAQKEHSAIPAITADDLKRLFADDPLFNERLLQKTLKIPTEKTFLFFLYCEDQHLKGTLLKEEHRFQLLDKLVSLAKEF